MAKAMGEILNAGIAIGLPNVNTSSFGFKPDAQGKQILYGLKAMLNVGDDVIERTISMRPFASARDYLERVKPGKQAMISLIKGGAFDSMMDRKTCMGWYIWETCDKKKRLTLQNMGGLMKYGMLPEDTEERVIARRIYEFNRYLKAGKKQGTDYVLDVRGINFLQDVNLDFLMKFNDDGSVVMPVNAWDKQYQSWMDVFRKWIADDKEAILQSLNEKIFLEDWNKYALGSISAWEMEALCFYYHDHELKNANRAKYGFVNFFNLPENPVVEKTFMRGGKEINIFKLSKICGTCIAKNKTKSSVSLLTVDGVVNVKFRKEYFALFDKQISARGADGVKHVVEKSWFNRGSMIVVMGIRSGDDFVSKKYASTGGHQLYKIDSIDEDGDLILRDSRALGEAEDGE